MIINTGDANKISYAHALYSTGPATTAGHTIFKR